LGNRRQWQRAWPSIIAVQEVAYDELKTKLEEKKQVLFNISE